MEGLLSSEILRSKVPQWITDFPSTMLYARAVDKVKEIDHERDGTTQEAHKARRSDRRVRDTSLNYEAALERIKISAPRRHRMWYTCTLLVSSRRLWDRRDISWPEYSLLESLESRSKGTMESCSFSIRTPLRK